MSRVRCISRDGKVRFQVFFVKFAAKEMDCYDWEAPAADKLFWGMCRKMSTIFFSFHLSIYNDSERKAPCIESLVICTIHWCFCFWNQKLSHLRIIWYKEELNTSLFSAVLENASELSKLKFKKHEKKICYRWMLQFHFWIRSKGREINIFLDITEKFIGQNANFNRSTRNKIRLLCFQ